MNLKRKEKVTPKVHFRRKETKYIVLLHKKGVGPGA
jgi:hypothetical protein